MKTYNGLLLGLLALRVTPSPLTINQPDVDRWMYPFNATPGTRSTASTFGAPGNPGFDERDAQFYLSFDTSGVIAPGLGAANYLIDSATLTLRHGGGDFTYDPTRDGYETYLDPSAPGHQADGDAGRPIELFGAGFRNGFTSQTFTESSPHGSPRNVYPVGFHEGSAVDVSNSLDFANNGASGFDPVLFGIGEAVGLSPGDTVTAGQEIVFHLNLARSEVRGFLQQQLDQGRLGLVATSFHEASQGGPAVYPSFDTKENLVGQAGSLSMDVTVVPEPTSVGLLLLGALFLHTLRRRRAGS